MLTVFSQLVIAVLTGSRWLSRAFNTVRRDGVADLTEVSGLRAQADVRERSWICRGNTNAIISLAKVDKSILQ